MKKLVTILKRILQSICIIIIIIIVAPILIYILNDRVANNTKKELLNVKLPNNTEIVDSISIAGKLTGNGNGMQYLGAILVKTDLSEEELKKYYNQYKKDEFSFLVEKQNSKKLKMIDNGSYWFEKYNENDREKYFTIYSWGESKKELLTEFDLRGH